MRKMLRRGFWFALIAAIMLAGLVYAFWPQPVQVDLATIGRGPMVVTIDGEGRTRVREIYLVSAPVPGRVQRIESHAGDEVAAGKTLLATVRPNDPAFLDRRAQAQAEASVKAAEAGFALSEAERAHARAELEFARAELSRSRKLAARGNLSQRNLDRAVLAERKAKAALATTEAGLTMRGYELETARAALIQPGSGETRVDGGICCVEVFSPVDGQVLRVLHESESVVAAGTPLLEIGDPGDIEIVADLLSSDAVRIAEGSPVSIEDWGGGRTLDGRVRRVEPSGFTKLSALGIEEQRVNVIVDFVQQRERRVRLGHGYRVEVKIVVWSGVDVVRLPLGALFRSGADWAVFAVVDGVAVMRVVRIGHRNRRAAEIIGGLAEGDLVVLHPSDQIDDGVRVAARP